MENNVTTPDTPTRNTAQNAAVVTDQGITDRTVAGEVAQDLRATSPLDRTMGQGSPTAEVIKTVKDVVTRLIPDRPLSTETQFAIDAGVIKDRLERGEPALTLIDVRDRQAFNDLRIMGAISLPLTEDLVPRAKAALADQRDIYLYGDSEVAASEAAQQLRSAGFLNVSEIIGGLEAWRSLDAPVEGRMAA